MSTAQDPKLGFNEAGVCTYCVEYDIRFSSIKAKNENSITGILNSLNKLYSKNKYNCITGISGGIDSTYVLHQLKALGLRPLVVHLDNGWNSELSVQNIENAVNKLGFDLYTYVINWDEFRDLQKSYIKANVVDIEALTDHAISAILYKMANTYNLKLIITGENFRTEGRLPEFWVHYKNDLVNIKAIHKAFGSIPIKTYPRLGYFRLLYYSRFKKISTFPLLDHIPYNKEAAKKIITEELGWRDYGGKHYESVFTRFFQSYILPRKFNIDKRYSHYSTLICSGQINREEALELIKEPIYDSKKTEEDKQYVIKKLGISEKDFDDYINSPRVEHTHYPSILKYVYLYQHWKLKIFNKKST